MPLYKQQGVTLLELMIVVGIIGILASIAYPSYRSYVVEARRSAAVACLSEYEQFMAELRATNLSYQVTGAPNLPSLGCDSESDLDSHYSFTVLNNTATRFTLRATPIGAQLTDDAQCGYLEVNQAGVRNSQNSTAEQCF